MVRPTGAARCAASADMRLTLFGGPRVRGPFFVARDHAAALTRPSPCGRCMPAAAPAPRGR
ncbi:hypothetical protein PI86_07015 [Burkholderia sp. A9]|nr:hypothetical protein PI86_07015 [Burkholderia sp. A9]